MKDSNESSFGSESETWTSSASTRSYNSGAPFRCASSSAARSPCLARLISASRCRKLGAWGSVSSASGENSESNKPRGLDCGGGKEKRDHFGPDGKAAFQLSDSVYRLSELYAQGV